MGEYAVHLDAETSAAALPFLVGAIMSTPLWASAYRAVLNESASRIDPIEVGDERGAKSSFARKFLLLTGEFTYQTIKPGGRPLARKGTAEILSRVVEASGAISGSALLFVGALIVCLSFNRNTLTVILSIVASLLLLAAVFNVTLDNSRYLPGR